MKFIAIKTADGSITGNISFYCKMLHVTRQGFYKYLVNRDRPWNLDVIGTQEDKTYSYHIGNRQFELAE